MVQGGGEVNNGIFVCVYYYYNILFYISIDETVDRDASVAFRQQE